MSLPLVLFRLEGGPTVGGGAEVGPTGIVGRMATAALCIDDPRVSEAHAMVSLRGGDLVLLALRGSLTVDRKKVASVPLRVGLRVEIVAGVVLEVVDLVLPTAVLGLSVSGGPAEPLVASVYSLRPAEGRIDPGFDPEAPVHVWAAAEGWRVRVQGGEPQRLAAGDRVEVDGHTLSAVELPARAAGISATVGPPQAPAPLTIVTRFETVHLHRADGLSVRVPGIPARILTELAGYGAPVSWEMVARTLWKGEADRFVLRQNWDRHLKALRARLREAGLRDDLVRPDGCGNVELFLHPDDQVVDES